MNRIIIASSDYDEEKLFVNLEPRQKISLQVILDGEVIFQSSGLWLFPLFDLEDHLKEHPVDMTNAEVRDKVIGKASALLILRLGAGLVHGDLMSELAVDVFNQASIPHTFDKLIKRIDCQTEEILLEINDPDVAHGILCKRGNRC